MKTPWCTVDTCAAGGRCERDRVFEGVQAESLFSMLSSRFESRRYLSETFIAAATCIRAFAFTTQKEAIFGAHLSAFTLTGVRSKVHFEVGELAERLRTLRTLVSCAAVDLRLPKLQTTKKKNGSKRAAASFVRTFGSPIAALDVETTVELVGSAAVAAGVGAAIAVCSVSEGDGS